MKSLHDHELLALIRCIPTRPKRFSRHWPADKPTSSPGYMFLPFRVEERIAIRQSTLKNPLIRPKRFLESVVRKKKRNALRKVILAFASAWEARDNQDDILPFLGNNFEFALLILTNTHKSLKLYLYGLYLLIVNVFWNRERDHVERLQSQFY